MTQACKTDHGFDGWECSRIQGHDGPCALLPVHRPSWLARLRAFPRALRRNYAEAEKLASIAAQASELELPSRPVIAYWAFRVTLLTLRRRRT